MTAVTIPQVAQKMQIVLTTVADTAARETGFVQRQSKMTGPKFAQTLVFGWLANPDSTLEELTQTAATLEVQISPQGLDERFKPAAAAFLQRLLDVAIQELIAAEPVAIPILQRFQGVYLLDSSTITLPEDLAAIWPGCGGRTAKNTSAALKVQVRLDLSTGALQGPLLQAGRCHDRTSPLQQAALPPGALRLADLGYFSLDRLAEMTQQGVYWLSRVQVQTAILDLEGPRLDLLKLLRTATGEVDRVVRLGAKKRLVCRLLAVRVPPEVAEQRRRKLREDARSQGQTVSKARLARADWSIFVTNVPVALLSLSEALVLARVRWQIELLFKLWKDHGKIDEWRSQKAWRILTEVYAKLLAMLVQHWIFLVSCWAYPDRSLRKSAQTVQRHALHLASTFKCRERLCEALSTIQRCLSWGCRINKRRKAPHTYQLLLALEEGGLT